MRGRFLGALAEFYICPRCEGQWWHSHPAPRGYFRICPRCRGRSRASRRLLRRERAATRAVSMVALVTICVSIALYVALRSVP